MLGKNHNGRIASVSIINVAPTQADMDAGAACAHLAWAWDHRNVRHTMLPPGGYGFAANVGGSAGTAPVIAVFNADVEITTEQLESCADHLMIGAKTGVLGPRQIDKHGVLRHCGADEQTPEFTYRAFGERDQGQYRWETRAVRVAGSALFIRRTVWNELTACTKIPSMVGPLLESSLYYEDTWLCAHALSHGYNIIYDGHVTIVHKWHRSIENALARRYVSPAEIDTRRLAAQTMYHDNCLRHGIPRPELDDEDEL